MDEDQKLEAISRRWTGGIVHSDCATCREKMAHAYDDVQFLLDLALDDSPADINWTRLVVGGIPWLSLAVLVGWFMWLVYR